MDDQPRDTPKARRFTPLQRMAEAWLLSMGFEEGVAQQAAKSIGHGRAMPLPDSLLARNVSPLTSEPCRTLKAPALANLLLRHGQVQSLIWAVDTDKCSASIVTLEEAEFEGPRGEMPRLPAFTRLKTTGRALLQVDARRRAS